MGANPNRSSNIDSSPIHLAIDTGSVEIVHCLINSGADINKIFTIRERDKGPYWQLNDSFRVRYHDWRILNYVAFECKSKIMKYLIEEHTPVNSSWQTDITIVCAFAKGILMNPFQNLTDIVETLGVLLKAGYNINIQEELVGKYPSHIIREIRTTCMKNIAIAINLVVKD
ncbi:unnamed protein product [Didymodactylos carnosus]|uniref:Ankyrin repeat protein n=1 Tax=Didymodactylos carnosus TaxID=1234261 RepID=A0A815TWC5_9BILA|nr:unnamed protein product [Didymodactylos carnosus]CAF1506133.1 unnamed protein product [Didymodactylos carnosus]CAF3890621.1 unnamed protein product [Didymodactylos carnosus]CAF4367369.1 unnamed protein product [Didymodactylos carnosus]